MSDHDERPFGWGTCVECGEDCEAEDYNPVTRTSTHAECLDEDVWCQRHRTLLPTKGASYCENCEPPEPDGEAFRGGEAAAYEREQMAHIQRSLK